MGGKEASPRWLCVYLQWCARSGLMLQHLGHLYTTCPGFSCKLSMNSLVAFPLGTAPCKKEERVRLKAPSGLTFHGGDGHMKAATTHPRTRHLHPNSMCTVIRIMPMLMNYLLTNFSRGKVNDFYTEQSLFLIFNFHFTKTVFTESIISYVNITGRI